MHNESLNFPDANNYQIIIITLATYLTVFISLSTWQILNIASRRPTRVVRTAKRSSEVTHVTTASRVLRLL